MALGLAAALLAACMYGGAATLQAIGTRQVPAADGLDLLLLARLLRVPTFDAALLLTLAGFGLHLYALSQLPLFLAQTGIAASLAVTAVLAVIVFGERLRWFDWAAVGAVCGGLALLSAASGSAGTKTGGTGLLVTLGVVLVLVVIGGVAGSRVQGSLGAGLLGLLAGSGYAVVGVCGGILPGFSLPDLVSAPASYLLVVAGVLAFLLYSLALQRGAVATSTAPMISLQTIGPAVIGVAVLGDTVRTGWWGIAVLGFVVTAVGALVLARFEGARDADPARSEQHGAGAGR